MIFETNEAQKNYMQDLRCDLVSYILLVPTVALDPLHQALLVVLRDPVANLFEALNNLVF